MTPDKDKLICEFYSIVTGTECDDTGQIPSEAYLLLSFMRDAELRGSLMAYHMTHSKHRAGVARKYGISRQGAERHLSRIGNG